MKWHVLTDDPAERAAFGLPGAVIEMSGELINENWMSSLRRVPLGSHHYYVKVYALRGRRLRRFMGRSRARAEWENLRWFEAEGIPTAQVVAFGEGRHQSGYRGVVVTRECPGTLDLVACAATRGDLMRAKGWRHRVIRRLAGMVQAMHRAGFVHGDLKWRNILVEVRSDTAGVFLIDCPQGRKMPEPFLSRGIIKDLACLYKVGRYRLSATDLLRFYLIYLGKLDIETAGRSEKRLDRFDKKRIMRIVSFFQDNE